MNGRFEPFRVEDLDLLEVQERHAQLVPALKLLPVDGVRRVMEGPYSLTYWDGNKPVAAGGVASDGNTWAFLGADMLRYMVVFTRKSREILRQFQRDVGPVHVDIDRSHGAAVRWAKALGLRQTSTDTWVLP